MKIELTETVRAESGPIPEGRVRTFEDAAAAARKMMAKLKAEGIENYAVNFKYDGFEMIVVKVSGVTP